MTDAPILLTINRLTAKALEIMAMPEAEFNRRNEMEMEAEIDRLRARIIELEAEQAITHGTLAQPTPDEPATIVHDVAPNAPR